MLTLIDWTIIVVYLAATVALGIACRGKQDSAHDYFTAGGSMTGLFMSILVGFSIAATLFSGISLLAYPSVVFSTSIAIMLGLSLFPLAWLVLHFWFLPQYLSSGHSEPYGIIEERMGGGVRTTTSVFYVFMRIGWMGALIYAPTVAIIAATNLDPEVWFWPLILMIGLSSTIYTTLGGIRGVIVTDALQFVVIAGGILIIILLILWRLLVSSDDPVTAGQVHSYLSESGRLHLMDFSLDFSKPFTVWSILISINLANMSMYLADQMSLQRYLASGSVKDASRSFSFNVIGVLVVLTLLALTGLALAAWYHFSPDPNIPEAADQVLPYFVTTQLPPGVSGLILAAILAATMSSMTSGINTLSSCLTLDFKRRFSKTESTPLALLRFGRVTSLVIGLGATLVAGLVDKLGDIFTIAQAILGLFNGPILAVIVLVMLRARIHPIAMIAAMIGACAVGWIVTFTDGIHNVWVAAFTFFFTVGGAFLLTPLINGYFGKHVVKEMKKR